MQYNHHTCLRSRNSRVVLNGIMKFVIFYNAWQILFPETSIISETTLTISLYCQTRTYVHIVRTQINTDDLTLSLAICKWNLICYLTN